ncbi:hypothetical protein chiPu_0001127 [Chiloscyllium punctatum]|uniref:Uncharacterized protein n=1 Tax=Chiloscyllium punctatum TaxID=137246 RepID=A0A401RXB5_CHIPU|nr:hypothetical protein [Chiloscyllium punctatum]
MTRQPRRKPSRFGNERPAPASPASFPVAGEYTETLRLTRAPDDAVQQDRTWCGSLRQSQTGRHWWNHMTATV